MTSLRAGVVGLGAIGRHHLRLLDSMPGVRLVGAVDPCQAARAAAPTTLVTPYLDELLSLDLDMCVVAAPTLVHAEVGMELARAGVHTLIEKPLAASARDGQRLADAFEAAGLVGCTGHVERYNPVLRALRHRVTGGDLGRIFQIATSRQGPYPDRIRDVGVVLDLASHDIDLTRWIAGSPYLTVSAYTTRSMARQHEDLAAVAGVLRDGTVVSHLVNWLSPLKERQVTVTGERGCLRADLLAAELWLVVADGMTQCPVSWQEPLRAELENFRDAVLGRAADIVTMRQGTEVLEVASAALAAVPAERPDVPTTPRTVLVLSDGSAPAAAQSDAATNGLVPAAISWRAT